jgi:hypothetical protein
MTFRLWDLKTGVLVGRGRGIGEQGANSDVMNCLQWERCPEGEILLALLLSEGLLWCTGEGYR